MKITVHSARDYSGALQALLPPGAAWLWPQGGMGEALLTGTAQELARVEASAQTVLDITVEAHRPKAVSWHISAYQRVADEVAGVGHTRVEHQLRPARVGNNYSGSRIGDRLWSHRSRFILRVRYDASVDRAALSDALDAFKQAHVFVWLETYP